jgi:hypothetical protein
MLHTIKANKYRRFSVEPGPCAAMTPTSVKWPPTAWLGQRRTQRDEMAALGGPHILKNSMK